MLHSGHVTFLMQTAEYGDLYVGIGSDYSIEKYKGSPPVCTQAERLFMIKAIKYVKEAWVNSGEGPFDFADLVLVHKINTIIVNEDQHSEEKEKFAADNGIEYIVMPRNVLQGLPERSTTKYRQLCSQ